MRLYLSSERLGTRVAALLDMLAGQGSRRPRVAVIANGHDHPGAPAARPGLMADFAALGLEPAALDLRAHFGDPQSLRTRLRDYDLAWASGGNSFVLRRAMRLSGFDRIIGDLVGADAIAYGGDGAGAAVAGPSLAGLELMDDPLALPAGDDEPPVWNGLGLIPFALVPHYRSRHPSAAAAEKVVAYLTTRKLRHQALSDGDAVVRMGNLERLAS
jgi:dipeptidase E